MATIEQVEKLREKANVTYDEAKQALEACGDDILDAMIYLERLGKVKPPQNDGYYNAKQAEPEKESTAGQNQQNPHYETFSGLAGKFFKWCGKIITKGNVNMFEVWRHNRVIISLPVTVLVVLLIFAFWFLMPAMVIALFFGCRYVFRGPDLEKTGMNHVMDSAAGAVENLKNELKDDKK